VETDRSIFSNIIPALRVLKTNALKQKKQLLSKTLKRILRTNHLFAISFDKNEKCLQNTRNIDQYLLSISGDFVNGNSDALILRKCCLTFCCFSSLSSVIFLSK